MPSSFSRILLALLAVAALVTAQDGEPPEPPAKSPADGTTEASAGPDEETVVSTAKKKKEEEIKVLKPSDIPGELARLKSKADIKAEVAVLTNSGEPVVFKGVIRNGKLIERIVDRRFKPELTLDHPRCGVRLWWSGGSDGFIFFRYSSIKTLSITGRLTEEERREILARLKAKREGKETKEAKQADDVEPALEKLSEKELEGYLLRRYPYDKGWDQKKYRELRRKQLIENKPLTKLEATFVKYFHVLAQARFKALKHNTQKIKIEPGSAETPDDPPSGGRGSERRESDG